MRLALPLLHPLSIPKRQPRGREDALPLAGRRRLQAARRAASALLDHYDQHYGVGADSLPGARVFTACIESLSGGAEAAAARAPRELSLTPRAGTAVIHFPTTSLASGCVPDPRTMHESEPAGEATKYIVQQFIWPVPIEPAGGRMHEDVRREWAGVLRAAEPPADQSEPAAADQREPPAEQSDLPAAVRSDPSAARNDPPDADRSDPPAKQSELDLPPRPDACSSLTDAEHLASAAGVRVCEQTAPGWVGQCGAIERSSFVRAEV